MISMLIPSICVSLTKRLTEHVSNFAVVRVHLREKSVIVLGDLVDTFHTHGETGNALEVYFSEQFLLTLYYRGQFVLLLGYLGHFCRVTIEKSSAFLFK